MKRKWFKIVFFLSMGDTSYHYLAMQIMLLVKFSLWFRFFMLTWPVVRSLLVKREPDCGMAHNTCTLLRPHTDEKIKACIAFEQWPMCQNEVSPPRGQKNVSFNLRESTVCFSVLVCFFLQLKSCKKKKKKFSLAWAHSWIPHSITSGLSFL